MSGIGFGREDSVKALKEKDDLDNVKSLSGIEDLNKKIGEAFVNNGSYTLISPDQQTYDTVDAAGDILERNNAVKFFLEDSTLLKNLNRFRRAFNKWKARSIREKNIPSPVESGSANYPAQKAQKTSRSKRKASEELQEAEKKLRGSVKGARNRALKEAGTSITEVRNKKKRSKGDIIKGGLEVGDIVDLDPGGGTRKARVKRINNKSITFNYFSEGGMGREKGVSTIRKDLSTLQIGMVKDGKLNTDTSMGSGLVARADPIENENKISDKDEFLSIGRNAKKSSKELFSSQSGQATFGSSKKKKKFGVDTRRNISIKDKSSEDQDKAKLDKMGEKLTSYTDNKSLADFSKSKEDKIQEQRDKITIDRPSQKKTQDFF